MKFRLFYILLPTFLLYSSCNKEELPEPAEGTPVFSVSGNGPIGMTAGENDFYMFSSYERDSLGVMEFIARFAKLDDCEQACSEALTIAIRDYKETAAGTAIEIDSALQIGDYPYFGPGNPTMTGVYVFSLNAEPEGVPPFFYEWSIDNVPLGGNSGQVVYTYPLSTNLDSLRICLNITDANGCISDNCDLVRLSPNQLGTCRADFTAELVQGGGFFVELAAPDSVLSGTPPYSYMWSTGELTDTIWVSLNNMQNLYCLTVTDAAGCSDIICKQITDNPAGGVNICSSRFDFDASYQPGNTPDTQLSTVKIIYTDPDGRVYRSDLQEQSLESHFSIAAVEDFEDNENGERTKKLSINGQCRLFAENGDTLEFPFDGVIAIAYP